MTCLRAITALVSVMLVAACVTDMRTGFASETVRGSRPAESQALGDFLVARFAAMTDDPAEAARRYEAAVATAPEGSGIGDRAVFAALQSGDFDHAVRVSKKAEAVGDASTLARLTLAVDALSHNRTRQADPYLQDAGYGPFTRSIVRSLKAWTIANADGPHAAAAFLTAGLTGESRLDSASLYMLGLMQLSRKEDAAALSMFQSLWRSGARLAVGVEAHAGLLASQGDREGALALLDAFRDEVGPNAGTDSLRVQIEAGKTIKLERLSMREGAALSLFVPAAALMTQSDGDVSAIYLVLALQLDPKLDAARSLWGAALENSGRRDEAIAVLQKVPEESAYYATARGQMAWSLLKADRKNEALAVAAEALRHSPDRGLKIQLADLYRSLGRDGEADTVLSEVVIGDLAEGRKDWRVLFQRGAARERLGRWPEAEADMKAALELKPDDASLLNHLGYSYLKRGIHLEEALGLIQQAVALEPQSGAIVDSLGWAYYQLGRFEMATRLLEQAVQIAPGNETLNDHLGDAYWQVGRRLEARFQWERALKLEPDEAQQATLKAKLESGVTATVLKQAESSAAGVPVPLPAQR